MTDVPTDQPYILLVIGAAITAAFALIRRLFQQADQAREDVEKTMDRDRQALREHMDTEKYDRSGRETLAENFRKEIRAQLDAMDVRSQTKLETLDAVTRAAHQRQTDMIAVVTDKVADKPSRDDMRSELMSIQANILARMTLDRRNSQGD